MRENSQQKASPAAVDNHLELALAAARGGDHAGARKLGWQAVQSDPQRESAWLLLASLGESREDVAMCLQQALVLNPDNDFVRSWLKRVLSGGPLGPTAITSSEVPQEPVTQEISAQPSSLSDPSALGPTPSLEDKKKGLSRSPLPKPEALDLPEHRAEGSTESESRGVVLVVDDSSTVRRVLANALQEMGLGILTASSGLEAFAMIQTQKPDLLILDVGLSHIDGHQICRAVRERSPDRKVPIFIMTGRHDAQQKSLEVGADEYLTKPMDTDQLAALIDQYLPKSPQETR